MFSLLLLLLACVGWWSHRNQWQRCTILVVATFAVLFIGTASGFLPRLLLKTLQHDNRVSPPVAVSPSTVFVLLTGGSVKVPGVNETLPGLLSYSRIVKTVQLYRECETMQSTCTILVSGGDPKKLGTPEAQTYQNQLLALGVPAKDIACELLSDNTYQEAQQVKRWLVAHPYGQVFLITSAFHMKRSVENFQRQGMDVIPAAADYLQAPLSVMSMSYNFMLMDIVVHEYIGLAVLSIYSIVGYA